MKVDKVLKENIKCPHCNEIITIEIKTTGYIDNYLSYHWTKSKSKLEGLEKQS